LEEKREDSEWVTRSGERASKRKLRKSTNFAVPVNPSTVLKNQLELRHIVDAVHLCTKWVSPEVGFFRRSHNRDLETFIQRDQFTQGVAFLWKKS
jgi:hypothetical protein